MDQVALVESQIEDGAKLAKELIRQGVGVTAAFWLKTSDDSQWYLRIATPLVSAEGLTNAYRRVHAIIRKMPQPFSIDPFEVKLLDPSSPLVEEVLAVRRRHPGSSVIRYAGNRLGNVSIDGAILYPLPTGNGKS